MQQHWYIVQSEPNREAALTAGLQMRSIEVFAPIVWRTVRKRRDAVHDVRRALFPGYIFVRTDEPDRIRSVPGFWDFLRSEDRRPACLSDNGIEFVRLVEAEIEARRQAEIARRSRKSHDFTLGQQVRIIEGPLTNFTAQIDRLDGVTQLRLLIDMFGRPTHAVVKANEIEAV